MTVNPPTALQLAKQGDASAIAQLINQSLQPKGITAKAALKGNTLQIMLEAESVPEQASCLALVRETLTRLSCESSWQIKVFGRETGEDFPAWTETFELATIAPEPITLAQQGDLTTINTLIHEWLATPELVVKTSLKPPCLQIVLETPQIAPDEQVVVPQLHQQLQALQIQGCQQVKILGREIGEEFPAWQQTLDLATNLEPATGNQHSEVSALQKLPDTNATDLAQTTAQPTSFWGSLFDSTVNAAGAIGGAVGGAVVSASGTVAGAVTNTAGAVGGAVVSASETVAGAVTTTAGAVGGAAVSAGQSVAGMAVSASGAVANVAMQVPGSVGYVLDVVNQSPALASLTQALKVDWLIQVVNQVDVVAAETRVKQLQLQYPHEIPADIANRIMLEKSLYVGGTGFATSLMPGAAVGLFAVDLLASTSLQAEMVYQIACAYGLDLRHPERKGEVAAIFGLALGGNTAIKAGLGFLRNVPIAGAVIGASTNAVALYALGYAACRFYEAKINPTTAIEVVAAAQVESEHYLQGAIAQQVIMDQILAHVVVAGNPGKTWEEILPDLQTLNFSPVSLEAIAQNIATPTPLEELLNQLNHDFLAPLIAQCQKIAELDGVTTPEEARVIETIIQKWGKSEVTASSL